MGTIKVPCEACEGTGKYKLPDGTQKRDCVFCYDTGLRDQETYDKWYESTVGLVVCVIGIWAFIGLQYILFFPALFGW